MSENNENLTDRVHELETEIKQLREERQAAAEREKTLARENVVQGALGGFKFAAPNAKAIATKTFLEMVEEAEDGTFVIQGQPASSYIEGSLSTEHSYLLEQERQGAYSSGPTAQKTVPVNFEDADRLMDAKQQAAYAGEILRNLSIRR